MRTTRLKRFWAGLALAFAFFIVYGTLFPFAFHLPATAYTPFLVLQSPAVFAWGDLVQNILLFLPLGYFMGKLLGRARKRWVGGALAVFAGGALSYAVEYMQLYLAARVTSPLDLVCNTLGTALGAWAAFHFAMPARLRFRKRKLRRALGCRWAFPALATLFLLTLELWLPFTFSLQPEFHAHKAALFATLPTEFLSTHALSWIWTLFLFALCSSLLAAWLHELGFRRHKLGAWVATLAIGFILEMGQFLLLSRLPFAWDMMLAALGSALGVVLWWKLPQGKGLSGGAFWAAVGLGVALMVTKQAPLPWDLNPVHPLHPMLVGGGAFWSTRAAQVLVQFFFPGFLMAYFIYHHRVLPDVARFHAALCSIGFLIGALWLKGGAALMHSRSLPFAVAGGLLGMLICWWALGSYRDAFPRRGRPRRG